jgi:hypothetical protein
MKRILGTLAVLALAAMAMASEMKPQTMSGYLVDVACASENAEKPKADFGMKHSKKCLTMPECEESGYALLTDDNKVIKFDAASNEKVKKMIATTDKEKDWKVAVAGTMNQDHTLKVDTITLK